MPEITIKYRRKKTLRLLTALAAPLGFSIQAADQPISKVAKPPRQRKHAASDLETFLLSAPTFTDKQLAKIDEARKSMEEWRSH